MDLGNVPQYPGYPGYQLLEFMLVLNNAKIYKGKKLRLITGYILDVYLVNLRVKSMKTAEMTLGISETGVSTHRRLDTPPNFL